MNKSRPRTQRRLKARQAKGQAQAQAQAQAQTQTPIPYMMIQIFDEHPYLLIKYDPKRVPKGMVLEGIDQEIANVFARRMPMRDPAQTDAPYDQMRVSGVPYLVPRPERLEPKSEESEPKPERLKPEEPKSEESEPKPKPVYPY